MSFSGTSTRYPDFKVEDIKNEKELSKKLSELTRAIDDRDKQTLHPFDIYGRTLTINSSNLVYVGTISGYKTYELTIDKDVGTVYINYPGLDASEKINIILPRAGDVLGRTISVTVQNPSTLPTNYSFSISTAPGSGEIFANIPNRTYPVTGTITATTTVTAPIISGSLAGPVGFTLLVPIRGFDGTNFTSNLYINGSGQLTTTPTSLLAVGVIDPNAIPVGGTITASAPTASTNINYDLDTLIQGTNALGWTFQIRAYFDKWLVISRD